MGKYLLNGQLNEKPMRPTFHFTMRLSSPYGFSDFVIFWVCSAKIWWIRTQWTKEGDSGTEGEQWLTYLTWPCFLCPPFVSFSSYPHITPHTLIYVFLCMCRFSGLLGISRSWSHHGRTQVGDPDRYRLAEALPSAGNPALQVPSTGQQDTGAAGWQGE